MSCFTKWGDEPAVGEKPRQMKGSILERLQEEAGFPISAIVSVTERCPLFCPHCYVTGEDRSRELTVEQLADLMDQLRELGVLKLIITGGEPAIRADLEEIVGEAWRRRFLISLKTSAASLTLERLRRMRKSGLSTVHVSLYHDDPALHDRFVGREGAYENALECMDFFASLGGLVTVGMVLMGWNAEAVGPLHELCDRRGWSFMADPKVSHAHDGAARPVKMRAEEDVIVQALERVRAPAEPSPKLWGDSLCKVGKSLVYFTSAGDVWLCPAIPVSIGTILEAPIKEIWEESKLRQTLLDTTWGGSARCMGCEHLEFCSRCPGESLLEHGDFNEPSTIDCLVARARARAASEDERR